MRTHISRAGRACAFGAVAVLLVVSSPGLPIGASGAQACDRPTQRVHLYAEELERAPDGRPRLGWGLTPETASIPGPLIEMYEGECIAITVVNNIPVDTLIEIRDDPQFASHPASELGVSLHVHGVKYTTDSDGTVHTDSWVPPGESRTYWWYAAPRVAVAGRIVSQGTAGYWWYHDHVIGTDHGSGGIGSGLWGGVVVRRPGDIEPDHTYTVVMGPQATINLEHHPEPFTARQGERVEFVVVGVGDEFHTFHLHGHNWADNRTGILLHQADETRLIDAKTVGPSETFGFQVIAGEGVGPGMWMLHCHVQFHSDLGMATFLDVQPSDGLPVPGQSSGGHHHRG